MSRIYYVHSPVFAAQRPSSLAAMEHSGIAVRCSALLCVFTTMINKSLCTALYRWARNCAVGTKNTTITLLWFEQATAAFTLVIPLAGICGHSFCFFVTTFWASNCRLQNEFFAHGLSLLLICVWQVLWGGDTRSYYTNNKHQIREILLTALRYQSPAIILAHNHPSGNIEPSEADKILTKDLVTAARAMELRIFDHVIIGENTYYSFADKGLIEEYEMEAIN